MGDVDYIVTADAGQAVGEFDRLDMTQRRLQTTHISMERNVLRATSAMTGLLMVTGLLSGENRKYGEAMRTILAVLIAMAAIYRAVASARWAAARAAVAESTAASGPAAPVMGPIIGGATMAAAGAIPMMQEGGLVAREGLAYLHPAEVVVAAGKTGGSFHQHIYAPVTDDQVQALEWLARRTISQYGEYSRERG